MSAFETQRPVDPNTKLNDSINLLRSRKANRTALLEALKEDLKTAETKKQLDDMDKEESEKAVKESVVSDYTVRRTNAMKDQTLFALEYKLVKDGYKQVFDTVIFEMAFNALWIDDSVKRTPENIKAMFETFVEIKENIEKVVPSCEDTHFIKEMKAIVTETVNKAAQRIAIEAKDDKKFKNVDELDSIKFELTDDEDKEMTDKLADLGAEEIIQLVKDKVLSVVQDEQKAGKEKSEMFKEMDEALKDEEPAEGEESPVAKESYDALANRGLRRRMNRGNYSTIFESIMVYNNKDIDHKIVEEGVDASSGAKANAVLMNSILHYTVLETLNTLKMYDLSNPINASKVIDMYKKN